MVNEKVQKVLARAGLGSRRQIENWIHEGRVRINGNIAKIGDRVDSSVEIIVDGYRVPHYVLAEKKIRVLLYHKPAGEMCTRRDPEGRPTVFDNLPVLRHARWVAVGRLDFQTSGLLLFTNEGELANQLMHPSANLLRKYAVRVFGEVPESTLQRLQQGVKLEDGMAAFDSVEFYGGEGKNQWYHVTLHEGRNREVRRLWESQGVKVSRLIRIAFGAFSLPPLLKPGHWEELSSEAVLALQESLKAGGNHSLSQLSTTATEKPRPFKKIVSTHKPKNMQPAKINSTDAPMPKKAKPFSKEKIAKPANSKQSLASEKKYHSAEKFMKSVPKKTLSLKRKKPV